MRKEIVITLIVCGTVLVALPPLSDYLFASLEASVLRTSTAGSVHLLGRMSEQYRIGCFLAGVVTLFAGLSGAMSMASTTPEFVPRTPTESC